MLLEYTLSLALLDKLFVLDFVTDEERNKIEKNLKEEFEMRNKVRVLPAHQDNKK